MMAYATSSPAATTGGGQGNHHIPVSFILVPCSLIFLSISRHCHLLLVLSLKPTKMMAIFTDHDCAHHQPVCQNCATSTTPLWRRDEIGSVLCNACGLFLKLHGTPRPISLKTDVIKSRHRVKTASQALKKRVSRKKVRLCIPTAIRKHGSDVLGVGRYVIVAL